MKIWPILIVFIVVGCERSGSGDAGSTTSMPKVERQTGREIQIKGSVFIATNKGVAYKLPLVQVAILESSVYSKTLADVRTGLLKDISEDLAKLDQLKIEVNERLPSLAARSKQYDDARALMETKMAALKKVASFTNFGETINLWRPVREEARKAAQEFVEAQHSLARIGQSYKALAVELSTRSKAANDILQKINETAAIDTKFIFAKIPPAHATKTDADGNFFAKANAPVDLVIRAYCRFQIEGNWDEFYWLVPVKDLGRDGEVRIMLSNDNLLVPNRLLSDSDFKMPLAADFSSPERWVETMPRPFEIRDEVEPPSLKDSSKPPVEIRAEVPRVGVQPVATYQVRPLYPRDMRRAGEAGEVLVDYSVNAEGYVENARAVKSTNRAFEAAAVSAVSQWRFRPGTVDGKPVTTKMATSIVFTLNEEY